MRSLLVGAVVGAAAMAGCSNDVSPRLIPGGGIGDGEIDGEVNVYVIDSRTDAPIAGATVAIGDTEKKTDAKGLVVFPSVEGAQTIAVLADGYRSGVWAQVNGANVTIPLAPLTGTPEQATLQGTIAGWSNITLDQGHIKAAFVLYSHTAELGDDANSISTPNNGALPGNVCIAGDECAWTVATRTGTISLIAIIVDRDSKGTLEDTDDTNTVIGYAYKTGITVNAGVNQSGLVLDPIEAGNLEMITIDPGTPPAGLTEVTLIPGIEVSADEIVQLPLALLTEATSLLVPRRTVFGSDATYRLTAIAQTASGADAAQSIALRQGVTDTTLTVERWLVPPVNVAATRATASFDPVAGAAAHSVVWADSQGEQRLEITVFDAKTGSLEVPNLVALPASGTFTARVSAIGADFNVNDFSLEADSALLWGISAQPTSIP